VSFEVRVHLLHVEVGEAGIEDDDLGDVALEPVVAQATPLDPRMPTL
jgi:hypothetical protein